MGKLVHKKMFPLIYQKEKIGSLTSVVQPTCTFMVMKIEHESTSAYTCTCTLKKDIHVFLESIQYCLCWGEHVHVQ